MNDVIKLHYLNNVIAVVAMEDRESKNTFSSAFITGLYEAFDAIEKNTELKVVVIHGYENYFCCGGTQEELLKLSSGVGTFADLAFYRLLLDCKIPVISAMQGHALGGGLAFGCFADLIVMAQEAFYATNFMKYGFTPGFGSTYIVPRKFNKTIAYTMLMSAQNYQGVILKELGVTNHFAKKADVIPAAIAMAEDISHKSRATLIATKELLTRCDRIELPKYIEQELAMHAISFKLPEVKEKIEKLFGR